MPQAPQKFAPVGTSDPQEGQRGCSGLPQDMQNEAPAGLSAAHVGQVIKSPTPRFWRVGRRGGDLSAETGGGERLLAVVEVVQARDQAAAELVDERVLAFHADAAPAAGRLHAHEHDDPL